MASALVATTGVGGNRVYAYDASGQRVAQVRVDQFGLGAVALDATVYVDSVEARDEQPLAPGGVSAQRFVSFGGATVAVESTGDAGGSVWSLMLGDVQGSAQVMVDLVVSVTATGWALFDGVSHGMSRAAYTPFGASRGDGLDVSRGWLGQVEDAGTGLTYLNARYYDPATMRFISPDPLMNPGDPRTLDPYRYANNNPVAFTDASGLEPRVWDDGRIVGTPASRTTLGASPRLHAAGGGGRRVRGVGRGDGSESIFDYGESPPSLGGHEPLWGYPYWGDPSLQPGGGRYGANLGDRQTRQVLGYGTLGVATIGLCAWATIECLAVVGIDGAGLGLRSEGLVVSETTAERAALAGVGSEEQLATQYDLATGESATGAVIAGEPRFLVSSAGVAYDVEAYAAKLPAGLSVPEGWVPRVANNGNGIVWQEPGAVGNVNMIRVADGNALYPNGYIRVYNEYGQPISVLGKPGPQSDTHVPVGYNGPWVGWPSE